MKFKFTLFCLFFGGLLFSQSAIELLPPDTTFIELNADISTQWEEFDVTVYLQNTTSDTLMMVWRKDMSDCPEEWETVIGDPYQHYIHFVFSNFDTSLNINNPVAIIPNQPPQFGFHVELYPRSVPGCCTIPLHISLLENPDSIITTGYYRFAINDPNCDFVNSEEVVENGVSVFPNPTSDKVFIETDDVVQSVQAFNLIGEKIKGGRFANGQLDFSGLPQGVFILKITLSNGMEIIKKMEKI